MKYGYYFTIALLSLLVLSACEKNELYPQTYITPDYVYNKLDSSGDYALQVLNNLYSYLPDGYNRIDHVVLGAATDDAISSDNYDHIQTLSQSILTAVADNPDGVWYTAYQAVRNVNLYLAHVDNVPIDETTKRYWKAEARFIRAINYFELIKRYGGVPLVGDKLFSQDDEVNIPRNTYQECVDYIVGELDAIKDSLRPDPLTATDLGRISKGADMALKSRVLLYAASPLNNPTDDLSKWQAAEDAAKDLIDYHQFSLVPDFTSIFVDRQNSGVILAYQRAQTKDLETQNAPVGYSEPNQSQGYVSPTQELVDAFPMDNGMAIADPVSGYDPDHPYQNRDPRLGATVFYNGSEWLQRTVETFEGGRDKPNSVQRQTRTGYYMRKFLADYSTQQAYGNQNHNFVIFRYGEVLLNDAEAANELGQTQTAYDQLKRIRERAGIKPGPGGNYGLKENMSQTEMRAAIHLERRIEMAFEEQRFWDVRRWKRADAVFNETLHGVKITQHATGEFSYQTVPVFKLTFAPKMYLYPIPFTEISANHAIVQNPGWQ
ncbi:MAG TPA: RagB/SusD family nutrient uptake outer membrane protein [Chitinophagaceae bacterium]|nr:RagB/SusD family nutrient uptake outer membrane protein [Chitinophagaceae bacterium]